ncbi:IS66 family insertion sequence element accessory protein TnpB [Burkholderia ubonensis]|uniref:IS66 family insertion sequence element accessory protein TnpB n=1 Tax=Burkholderia ubonensis TaxID=101571 RepID=UPI000B0ED15A|nr:IS66 family insertion sequence element accessory protein TnpB [Burkholderia ubonensis]
MQAESTSLIPVAVVHETPPACVAMPPDALGVGHPTQRTGTIEIRIGGVVVKVDGVVDAETLRAVLGSLRS